jgi:N4-gp56 family major capsid protein
MAFDATSAGIKNATISLDQEKFLEMQLLHNAMLTLSCGDICIEKTQPEGTGEQAHFIRYVRMNIPLAKLTEGITPTQSSFAPEEITVDQDQWGDVVVLSDRAQYTARHPLVQTAVRMLADNAARVIDREIQLVWLAGTNVQFGNGTVTTRRDITSAMTMDDATIGKARVTLVDGGASPRGAGLGDQDFFKQGEKGGAIKAGRHFVAIASTQVMEDIMQENGALGVWLDVAMYNDAQKIYNAEVGIWRKMRWVESNFLPKFVLLGTSTAAVASLGTDASMTITAVNGGGTLTSGATYFWKVTRKDLKRGFEEAISIAHSTAATAAGNDESFTFLSAAAAGFAYNLYFDTVAGGGTGTDATMRLVHENVPPSTTVTVTAVPATGANPPDNIDATGGPASVHPVYIHGEESCAWVGMQKLKISVVPSGATKDDPLDQRKPIGYKFMGKTIILNQAFMLRIEVASAF